MKNRLLMHCQQWEAMRAAGEQAKNRLPEPIENKAITTGYPVKKGRRSAKLAASAGRSNDACVSRKSIPDAT
jgi:hypothetical protein